ncbi:MAG: ATP synthase F1 subunit delta [Ignavibacteriales bacterium]|nr:ATP synthase F1 subunit delta [Ignavibacteriales bacterium]
MSAFRVARRYAEAAIELAEDQKQGERLAGDLELIQKAMRESLELQSFLKNPVISKGKKRAVLDALFKSKVGTLAFDFLNLLVEKGREDVLDGILVEYFKMRDDQLGIMTLELRAAVDLSIDQQKTIAKRFEEMTRKKIRVVFSVDKRLKGGFVARVGDTVYDGSVSRQLELLRSRFAEGAGRN